MTIEQIAEEDKTPSAESIEIEEQDSYDSSEEQDSSEDREQKEDSRFKEGQILRFVRVRFPGNSRSFPFLLGKRHIEYGQKVVAMSDRGMAVGYVNSFPYDVPFNKGMLPIRSISKVANSDDLKEADESYKQQKRAENTCNDLIEYYKLDMHLTHVEFTSFGKKAVFYFIAPSRVDFRDLVKDLVGKLKMRIELRQISVRDRSAAIGGIGPCGRELCCSSFLTKYGNVGIKMAKNQDLTLNFSKLNGVCGQLKCCLQYEDEVYKEKRSRLPKEGEFVQVKTGEIGRVDRLHLLEEQFDMMTTRGVRKRFIVDYFTKSIPKEEANFPQQFDSVSDETHKVVGLEEYTTRKTAEHEAEMKSHQAPSKDFAEKIFESLFGEKSLNYQLPEISEPESGNTRKVKTPDDEEEIQYTMSEDEVLPEDDESLDSHAYDVEVRSTGVKEERRGNDRASGEGRNDRGPRRDQGNHRQQNNRPRQNNNGQNQNRGPRPEGQQNRGNDNRNRQQGRPQGQNQNRGPRPEGQNQNPNQNRGQRPGR